MIRPCQWCGDTHSWVGMPPACPVSTLCIPGVYWPKLPLPSPVHGSTLVFLGLHCWLTPANTFSQLQPRPAGWELFILSSINDFTCSNSRSLKYFMGRINLSPIENGGIVWGKPCRHIFFKVLHSTLIFNIDFAFYSIVFYLPSSKNGISRNICHVRILLIWVIV